MNSTGKITPQTTEKCLVVTIIKSFCAQPCLAISKETELIRTSNLKIIRDKNKKSKQWDEQ